MNRRVRRTGEPIAGRSRRLEHRAYGYGSSAFTSAKGEYAETALRLEHDVRAWYAELAHERALEGG